MPSLTKKKIDCNLVSSKPTVNQVSNSTKQSNAIDSAKIFVGGLSWQTTSETLRYHFEQYGEVLSVEVMRDRATGDPRGFAFVIFACDSTVELVIKNTPHEINRKIVDVKRAQARGSAPPSIHKSSVDSKFLCVEDGVSHESSHNIINKEIHTRISGKEPTPEQLLNKIFVGGLPMNLDSGGLQKYFESFGPVVDAIVMIDPIHHRSRGFGFVTFENGSKGAKIALESQPVYINDKYVEIKLATPKEDNPSPSTTKSLKINSVNKKITPILLPERVSSITKIKSNPYVGLASAYGRKGWKAGIGTMPFLQEIGWKIRGWEAADNLACSTIERTGFSFSMLKTSDWNMFDPKRAKCFYYYGVDLNIIKRQKENKLHVSIEKLYNELDQNINNKGILYTEINQDTINGTNITGKKSEINNDRRIIKEMKLIEKCKYAKNIEIIPPMTSNVNNKTIGLDKNKLNIVKNSEAHFKHSLKRITDENHTKYQENGRKLPLERYDRGRRGSTKISQSENYIRRMGINSNLSCDNHENCKNSKKFQEIKHISKMTASRKLYNIIDLKKNNKRKSRSNTTANHRSEDMTKSS